MRSGRLDFDSNKMNEDIIQKNLELNTTHFNLLYFILGKHTEVRELRIGVMRNQVLAVSSANIKRESFWFLLRRLEISFGIDS